jgi:hypothetical protein
MPLYLLYFSLYLLYLAVLAVCSDYFNVSSAILPRIALIFEIHLA